MTNFGKCHLLICSFSPLDFGPRLIQLQLLRLTSNQSIPELNIQSQHHLEPLNVAVKCPNHQQMRTRRHFFSLVDSGLKSDVLTSHDVHHQHFLPSALPANANQSLPLTVPESVFRKDYRDLSSAELLQEAEKNFSKISVTKSQAEFLEKATILQADSTTWHIRRHGRITASKV